MANRKHGDGRQPRVGPMHLFAAAAILGLLVMPVAFAGSGGPGAAKSAKITKQIKKLKRRLAAVEARPDQVGQVQASLPPSGPAGGDLAGIYPNPLIGPNAVASDEVVNNSLTGVDIAENTVNIPRAWALVNDPPGTPPAGDPAAAPGFFQGVNNINDGDDGVGQAEGLQCYDLDFVPDLVLVTPQITGIQGDTTVRAERGDPFGLCGAGYDAQVSIRD